MSTTDFPQGVALVIGGSGGNGAVICEKLAEAGSDVVLTYHGNEQRAAETTARLQALGRKAEHHQLSIGDATRVKQLIDQIAAKHRIHTVVVAAGSDIPQLMIRDVTPEQWKKVVDADVNGFFNIVHAALPHMKEAGGGSFVHISSAGLNKWPERDVLSVAPKAAIEWLIQGIAKEEGRFNIRANSVAIGVINAGIFKRLWADGSFDEAWKEAVQAGLCLKRWGEPEEVAHAVVYLASQRAAYVTGQIICVDGGYGV
ncbi:MAG TPA: SDR family NAD(P)-dependent oxidoreductase [Spongiibacteraceae bacterium]|jgi:NAD(P)-dependent dehydrogenase (short-subunit alcohol dehydrogenase family)|nr:SDR family NAD(P)-dependent oxidoreductase [Spongiibacteraceae bacterium]HUH38388.1 SDR family NAD(P)-dependent oxidoreductase [Spongiibacteraceae bacterium]